MKPSWEEVGGSRKVSLSLTLGLRNFGRDFETLETIYNRIPTLGWRRLAEKDLRVLE